MPSELQISYIYSYMSTFFETFYLSIIVLFRILLGIGIIINRNNLLVSIGNFIRFR